MNPDRPDNLEEQLSAYLDGELTDAERAEVEAYLAGHEDARRTLAELSRNAGLLHSLPRAKAPDGLLELISAQMEREELLGAGSFSSNAPAASRHGAGRWLASAAVILLAASAGYLTFTHLRQGPGGLAPSPIGPVAEVSERPGRPSVPEALPAPSPMPAAKADRTEPAVAPVGGVPVARLSKAKGARTDADAGGDKAVDSTAAPPMEKKLSLAKDGAKQKEAIAVSERPVIPEAAEQPRSAAAASVATMPYKAAKPAVFAKGGGGAYQQAGTPAQSSVQTCQEARLGDAAQSGGQSYGLGMASGLDEAFELRLVYADAAARDAATAVIEGSLRKPREFGQTLEGGGHMPGPGLRSDGFAWMDLTPSPHVVTRSEGGTTLILVEGPPAVAEVAMKAIEQAGLRTQPVRISVQGGAATDWAAVRKLAEEYLAGGEALRTQTTVGMAGRALDKAPVGTAGTPRAEPSRLARQEGAREFFAAQEARPGRPVILTEARQGGATSRPRSSTSPAMLVARPASCPAVRGGVPTSARSGANAPMRLEQPVRLEIRLEAPSSSSAPANRSPAEVHPDGATSAK